MKTAQIPSNQRSALLLILMSFFSWSVAAQETSDEIKRYSAIFPYWMEYCAGTKLDPLVGSPGGAGGHAILYINGLCKNNRLHYPQLIECGQASSRSEQGAGVSVDSQFKNVNWVAVPGRDLFLFGDLSSSETVDQASIDPVVERALQLKIFEGVHLASKATEAEIAREAIGTDIALAFGRSLSCVRIPIQKSKLKNVENYLNGLNQKYFLGGKEYHWSGISDNCSHVSSNAFAAAGIRNFIPMDQPLYQQIWNLAVPANGLITLRNIANFSDQSRPGGISVDYPIYRNNHVFKTDGLWALTLPPVSESGMIPAIIHSDESVKKPEYSQLLSNLEYWKKRYQEMKADSKVVQMDRAVQELEK